MIRVLVIEDEGLFREMVVTALSADPEIEVVGSAATGPDAINLARRLGPSVVVMDIELGSDPNGIEAGKIIKDQRPYPGIVLLSQHKGRQYVANLPLGEASGWSYLLKHNVDDTEALLRAIRGAAWGLMTVDREVLEQLTPREGTAVSRLSAGQRQVLELVAQGYTDDAIGQELGVSEEMALHEVSDLFQSLGLEEHGPRVARVQAVLLYLQETKIS